MRTYPLLSSPSFVPISIVLALALAAPALTACGAGHYTPDRPEEEPEKDPTLDWPKDAVGLLAHLNTWNKQSLEAHERPDLDMSKHLNAETDGTKDWVDLHAQKLQALGISIRWNAESKVYEKQ
jgi:hypothetical protein